MSAERHARAKELFLRACELEPAQRTRFVEASCAGDAELRAAVDELLESDAHPPAVIAAADAGGTARRLAHDLAGDGSDEEELPSRIGAYRVVRLLGRGGMGVVYEAEQDNPRRRVAVKVLSVGLGSTGHLQRFGREAELLGRLHHPGIAHVYEAGTTSIRGAVQPYFAMELVEGTTLVEHARRRRSSLDERVELLVQICEAVQHAHEAGILHRDLKPTNVVVDAAGRAKVLDFGVARLLERAEGDPGTATGTGLIVGTLATMSPEQVSRNSAELDARSDVYSLGVIGYELLTGRVPLDVARLPLPEAARMICEHDPPLAGALERSLRGDLETILAKALSKDRAQRYGSARELALDLQRYLRREPIAARPASTFYHLRMFARRNRALVAGALVAAFALVAGSTVAAWFAWHESQLRVLADESTRRAEREAYRGNVVAAGLALEQGNARHAHTLLSEIERLPRGWEWHRVRRGTEPWIASEAIDVGLTWQAGFIGDGRTAVVIGRSGAVVVWDTETGVRELELPADPERAYPLALSTDGRVALSASEGALRLWDPRTGEERARVALDARALRDPRAKAAVAPDGSRFAVRTEDQGFLLFDAADAEPRTLETGLAAFGRAGVLATASPQGVTLWRLDDLREIRRFPPVAAAFAIAVDAAGDRIAVASTRQVHLFDIQGGVEVALPESSAYGVTALAFSPDGRRLAAMLDNGSLWVWDVVAGALLERFGVDKHSWKASLAWSSDGERLLTAAHAHDAVRTWSLDEGQTGEALRGHTSYVYPVAYTPDGSRIVSGSWDGTLRIWSARTRELLATLGSGEGRVHALAVSPDGRRVVGASSGRTLILWDARTGDDLSRVRGGAQWTSVVAFAPDGRTLAAADESEANRLRILDASDLRTLRLLPDPEEERGAMTALAFDPSGALLASASIGGSLVLREVASGSVRARVRGLPDLRSVAFSPDGARLAVAGDGRFLALFDVPALSARRDLAGHLGEVFAAAFSPDGSRIFSGGRDGLLRVWDAESGNLLGEFGAHRDYIWSLAVSPDGTRVATGSGDFDVRQWESEPVPETHQRREDALALRVRAGPRVEALIAELGDFAAVAAHLESDPALSDDERRAALDRLLSRAAAGR